MLSERPECQECGLKDFKSVSWQHPINIDYQLLVIGQAPGATEVLTKTPFTGPAGKMLWRIMFEGGIDKSKVFVSNICCCAPPEDREPSLKEIGLCHSRLVAEINICKPKLILALGEVAVRTLTGRTGIQSQRGQFFPLLSKYNYECQVFCALHPSFIMRQRQWIDIGVKDIKKVREFLLNGTITKPLEPTFVIDPPASELAEMLEKMTPHITSIDIETPGQLDVLTAKVIGIAFCCNEDFAVGLNFTTEGPRSEQWEIMKKFLEDKSARKCAQNGQFDLAVLETNGVIVKGLVWDTLLAEHTMNSDLPGNLDALRSRYTDILPYKPIKKDMKQIGSWTAERRASYNCWDVVTTHKVRLAQELLMGEEQKKVLETIEVPLIYVCNYMQRKGILVDKRKMGALCSKIIPEIKRMEEQYFDPIHLNPRSPLQVKKYLNIDATGEDELNTLIRRGHPQKEFMETLLEYRGLDKTLKTYLLGVNERLIKGRIHAQPRIAGTGTGRLSYQNPNLQNVPALLRNIYIPDSEDCSFLEADYSQLELRVIGLLAPEPTMIQEFAEGKRIHDIMGKLVYQKEWADMTPTEHVRAKAVVFGTVYGRSARSIAIEFGVPIKEAERWQMICVNKYPGIREYTKHQTENFYKTHRTSTPFGRVRFLQTVLQSYNTPIQSSASDVMLTSLIELFKKNFDLRITVHDSVIIHTEDKLKKEVINSGREILQRPIEQLNNYQFPTKIKEGKDWYNMKEVVI